MVLRGRRGPGLGYLRKLPSMQGLPRLECRTGWITYTLPKECVTIGYRPCGNNALSSRRHAWSMVYPLRHAKRKITPPPPAPPPPPPTGLRPYIREEGDHAPHPRRRQERRGGVLPRCRMLAQGCEDRLGPGQGHDAPGECCLPASLSIHLV